MIVIDTNVILDYFDEDRAGHEDAQGLIGVAQELGYVCAVSSSALPTVFYLDRTAARTRARTRGWEAEQAGIYAREHAWKSISFVLDGFEVMEVNREDVELATRLRELHGDFEDNLIVAAAVRCGATAIATADAKLIAHSPLKAGTPRQVEVWIRAEALAR